MPLSRLPLLSLDSKSVHACRLMFMQVVLHKHSSVTSCMSRLRKVGFISNTLLINNSSGERGPFVSPIIRSAPKCSGRHFFFCPVPSKPSIVFSTHKPFYSQPNYSSGRLVALPQQSARILQIATTCLVRSSLIATAVLQNIYGLICSLAPTVIKGKLLLWSFDHQRNSIFFFEKKI